jgi:hypothetical protein
MASPIDKGRASVIVEKYDGGKLDQNNQPKMSNRYATVGRATKWPGENGRNESVEIDLDTIPLGATGPIKIYIFWDSEKQDNQQQNNNQGQQQPPQQGYGGPNGYQNQPNPNNYNNGQ